MIRWVAGFVEWVVIDHQFHCQLSANRKRTRQKRLLTQW